MATTEDTGRSSVSTGRSAIAPSIWSELVAFGVYKRSQGRIARQATFAALAIAIALGVWSLYGFLAGRMPEAGRYATTVGVLVVGVWFAFRLVNIARFADFLISVEAEMNKVSWPTRLELVRSSIVVMVTIFGLATLLFVYDLFWQFVLGPSGLGIIGK